MLLQTPPPTPGCGALSQNGTILDLSAFFFSQVITVQIWDKVPFVFTLSMSTSSILISPAAAETDHPGFAGIGGRMRQGSQEMTAGLGKGSRRRVLL